MDLLLWRHAEAEPGDNDMRRKLTGKGLKQANHVARWLLAHQPRPLRVLVSPATRTQQTAEALGLPFEMQRRLAPSATPDDLIEAAGWPDQEGAVLIIGHQPTLGRVASRLLFGQDSAQTLSVRKGALWWFSHRLRDEETQTVLRTVIAPDFL